jgi:radical SAM protein with 4Fe4S-binding SPASM domain
MVPRYLNASYSLLSYAARRYGGISHNPPLPPAISVELSSSCNLACPECMTGAGLLTRRASFISYSLAADIASQLRGHVLSAWLSFQGEPMLHPEFFRITELFRGMGPVISTNGHYLDRENCISLAGSSLNKIIVSYDGVTPGSYCTYRRGGDHRLVTEGIRRLTLAVRERKSKLKVVLQFLIHRHNEHEVRAAAAFAASVGAGFRIKSMQLLDPDRAGEWMPSDRQKARYPVSGGGARPAGRTPSAGCLRIWTSAVITADGDVVPCCYDKNAGHVMGNMQKSTFRDIWKGEEYRIFREKVMKDRRLTDICINCPQGSSLFFRS